MRLCLSRGECNVEGVNRSGSPQRATRANTYAGEAALALRTLAVPWHALEPRQQTQRYRTQTSRAGSTGTHGERESERARERERCDCACGAECPLGDVFRQMPMRCTMHTFHRDPPPSPPSPPTLLSCASRLPFTPPSSAVTFSSWLGRTVRRYTPTRSSSLGAVRCSGPCSPSKSTRLRALPRRMAAARCSCFRM